MNDCKYISKHNDDQFGVQNGPIEGQAYIEVQNLKG